MSVPNLLSPTTVTGKAYPFTTTTANSAVTIVTAGASESLYIPALYVTNITAGAIGVTVDIFRSSTAYRFGGKAMVYPSGAPLNVFMNGAVRLEGGDALRITCDTLNGTEGAAFADLIT